MKRYYRKAIVITLPFALFCIVALLLYYSKSPGLLKQIRMYITTYDNVKNGIIDKKDIYWLTFRKIEIKEKNEISNILDVTHPSVVYTKNKWNKHNIWIAVTPYPESIGLISNQYENSSIYFSDITRDGKISSIKPIKNNPIIYPDEAEYNSDPDLLFNNNKLYCLTRKFNGPNYLTNIVIQSSKDGQHWTSIKSLLKTNNLDLCPCLVKINNVFRIYTFNTGYEVSNILSFKYNYRNYTKEICIWESKSLDNPHFTLKKKIKWEGCSNFWHGDIVYYKNKFYMIYCGCNNIYKDCFNLLTDNFKYLWFAVSNDGYNFKTCKKPIIKRAGIYRPSFFISQKDIVTILFATEKSYYDTSNKYPAGNRIGSIQIKLADLLKQTNN